VISGSRRAPQESPPVIFSPIVGRQKLSKGQLFLAPFLFLLSFFGLSFSLAMESSPAGAEGQAKIAVSANLVLLPVKVTDSRGIFAEGLKLQDFHVYEDGQLQELTIFEEGDTPVTVGLIVDHSRSMGPKLRDVITAVSSFAHSSNPRDEMFVVDFNDSVLSELMKGKAFTNDSKELEEALASVTARGRTALYDAVSEGLHHLEYGHLEKKALIVISDGGDNASHLKYPQVLGEARKSQTMIYAIGLVGADDKEENPGLLRRLCKDTGGVAYFPREGESVAKISVEIARDLREQYTLGYVPQNPQRAGAFRKIEVKVATPGHGGLRVRTRQGYSLAAGKSPATQLGSETR
jgi:Ca-activated chloride channel family protein